jgi:predicted RNA-binding Zn-ribbon protein involved in translation (DUF1610 family)
VIPVGHRRIEHATCRKCSSSRAILALDRFGVNTYFCPQCNEVWDNRQPDASSTPFASPAPLKRTSR